MSGKNYSAKIDEAKQDFTNLLTRLSEAAIGCQRDKNLADPFTSVAHLTSIMGEIADSACRLEHALLDKPSPSLVKEVAQPKPYATIYGKKWNYRFNRAGEVIEMQALPDPDGLEWQIEADWEPVMPQDNFVLPEVLTIPIRHPSECNPDAEYEFIMCRAGYHYEHDNVWHWVRPSKDDQEFAALSDIVSAIYGNENPDGVVFFHPVTQKLIMNIDPTAER